MWPTISVHTYPAFAGLDELFDGGLLGVVENVTRGIDHDDHVVFGKPGVV